MNELQGKILVGITTLIIGFIINQIWNKYKSRITKLKYSIWHNYLGSSMEDVKFGSVKLLYNENEIKNLYSSNVVIKNDTGKDVDNLELNITCDDQSLILVSNGKNLNSIKELSLTENYTNIAENNDPDDQTYIYTHRDYVIPVINRGDSIEITLLTTNFENKRPFLHVTSEHKGVKLKYFLEPVKLLGVSQNSSTLIGLIISLIVCYPILYFFENPILIIALALFNGWTASLYGVFILKTKYWINKQFE